MISIAFFIYFLHWCYFLNLKNMIFKLVPPAQMWPIQERASTVGAKPITMTQIRTDSAAIHASSHRTTMIKLKKWWFTSFPPKTTCTYRYCRSLGHLWHGHLRHNVPMYEAQVSVSQVFPVTKRVSQVSASQVSMSQVSPVTKRVSQVSLSQVSPVTSVFATSVRVTSVRVTSVSCQKCLCYKCPCHKCPCYKCPCHKCLCHRCLVTSVCVSSVRVTSVRSPILSWLIKGTYILACITY